MKNEGLTPTPRPVPSWFHPPMALPPPPKEEIIDHWPSLPPSETSSKDDVELDSTNTNLEINKDNLEPGVTPPLMSPLASPMGGMVSPFQGMENMPPGVMDPRHILHLLTRKVRQLFAEICSNGSTILIKLSVLILERNSLKCLCLRGNESFITFIL